MGKNHMYSATVSTRLITAGRCKSEKPNGSQRAASTLMTRGVDTDASTPKTVATYAFVWLHELRLHEHRLLAMLPRCSLGA